MRREPCGAVQQVVTIVDRTETIDVRCPVCAGSAHATVEWRDRGFDTPHGEVTGFACPNGCDVDLGTVRTMIGAQ